MVALPRVRPPSTTTGVPKVLEYSSPDTNHQRRVRRFEVLGLQHDRKEQAPKAKYHHAEASQQLRVPCVVIVVTEHSSKHPAIWWRWYRGGGGGSGGGEMVVVVVAAVVSRGSQMHNGLQLGQQRPARQRWQRGARTCTSRTIGGTRSSSARRRS
jgi:hypothetical protein